VTLTKRNDSIVGYTASHIKFGCVLIEIHKILAFMTNLYLLSTACLSHGMFESRHGSV